MEYLSSAGVVVLGEQGVLPIVTQNGDGGERQVKKRRTASTSSSSSASAAGLLLSRCLNRCVLYILSVGRPSSSASKFSFWWPFTN